MRRMMLLVGVTVVLCGAAALGLGCGGERNPGSALGVQKGEPWDLLYVSDSTGWGVAEQYAKHIERDLGVTVRVHDSWVGGLSIRTILDALRSKSGDFNGQDLHALVRDAEVIVVFGNPEGSETPGQVWNCPVYQEPTPECLPSTACGPETFRNYVANITSVFDEISALRDGRPVILRTTDPYLPWGPRETWRSCDQEKICLACYGNYADAMHRAAAARKVPIAGLFDAFTGPAHDREMPRAYIRDPDPFGLPGVHPSDAGAAAIADVLANLGYEPVGSYQ